MDNAKNGNITLKLTQISTLSSLAIVIGNLIRFPLIPGLPFLYDPAGIFLTVGALLYGPWTGLSMVVVVSILSAIIRGDLLEISLGIFVQGSLVLTVGFIYKKHKPSSQILSFVVAIILFCICGSVFNFVMMALIIGIPQEFVLINILSFALPFFFIYSLINSIVSFVLAKFILKNKLYI